MFESQVFSRTPVNLFGKAGIGSFGASLRITDSCTNKFNFFKPFTNCPLRKPLLTVVKLQDSKLMYKSFLRRENGTDALSKSVTTYLVQLTPSFLGTRFFQLVLKYSI